MGGAPAALLSALLAGALLAGVLLAAGCTPRARPAGETDRAAAVEATEARLREAARLRGLALADMEEDRYASAAAHLERLAELLPENILPPVNLAICYFRLNRLDDAWREIERARALDPANPSLLYTVASILEEEPGANERRRELVRTFANLHPYDVRPHYLEARALAREGRHGEAADALRRGLEAEPENLVLLADLLVASAAAGDSEGVTDALNAIEDRLDGLEGSLADYAATIRARAAAGDLEATRPAAVVMRNLLRPGELYRVHLAPLIGGRGPGGAMFPQLDFVPPLPPSIQGGLDIEIAFADATAGLPRSLAGASALALGAPEPGREAVLAAAADGLLLWRLGAEETEAVPAAGAAGASRLAVLHELDGDEIPDLALAGPGAGVRLFAGLDGGGYGPGRTLLEPPACDACRALLPLDVDHDGDLDLFLLRAGAPDLYLQNHGDGRWSERAGELGIAGGDAETTGAAVADFDDDGDLDLLATHRGAAPRLYLNPRAGALREARSDRFPEALSGGHDGVRAADFDNDGRFDLLLWGAGGNMVLRNREARFEAVELPGELPADWAAAAVADFDNDGDQDVVVAPAGGGPAILARNRGGSFTAEPTGLDAGGVERLLVSDLDADGDLDLLAAGAAGSRLWRNDGGNRNHWVRLALKGRRDNNSKNNVEGLFCRVEARIGDAFQVVLGNGRINHLGLGARRQADVLRVVWTNGIAQLWQLVTADRTLVEEQMLKGSCPFLYAWDGEAFRFVTDLMWRSPLGMRLADGSAAPHQSARDFVLVPGEALRPAGDELWLQVTEELWETAYVDRHRLLAVDHPETIDLVVDEAFRPPPHPAAAPLHWIGRRLTPRAARDERGRDVLDAISRRDGRHVDELPLDRYQGLTRGHALELDFPPLPPGELARLVLWGWIFPTDTSINFALSQDSSRSPWGPRLEALDGDGRWRVLSPFIGFPNGKRKAVVVPLEGLPKGGSIHLRLSTNLQIYWDAAVVALGPGPAFAPVVTALDPVAADVHYRGYSRLYRESPTGPHLFDYAATSVEPRFRDMSGAFTRFGEVTDLLTAEDDRYVVMNAGDELTVRFDASRLPPLPPGWRRDWVLFTDGWVKDADLHTAASQTVDPLPYHGMSAYPDRPAHHFPDGPEHRAWRERYQTREVTDRPFRDALKPRPAG